MSATETPPFVAPVSPTSDGRTLARRLVVTYLVLTAALSTFWYVVIIRAGGLQAGGGPYVIGMMWSPGISALITRLAWQRNVRGEGWGWGATRWQGLAYLVPLLYAAVAYGAVWLLGLGGVDLGWFTSQPLRFPTFVLLGTVMSCISALGEELGWRGLLVPELAKLTSFTRLSLLSGSVWALWHMPAIFFAGYDPGATTHLDRTPALYAAACFAVMVIGISFVFAWIRLKSGSVWTGMLLHASHNLWIQGFFDRVTTGRGHTAWFTTEFGAALALTAVLAAFAFWRFRDRLPQAATRFASGS